MNEINNTLKQFANLQHGDCWIGCNFKEALHGVDAALACRKADGDSNSIWQLVNHLVYWRTTVVNRLNGSNDKPPFADFLLPEILDEEHWRQTLHDFEASYHSLRSTIHHFKAAHLYELSVDGNNTHYELMLGCLQHDAYHMGQVVLLKKRLL